MESKLAERVRRIMEKYSESFRIAFLPHINGVSFRISKLGVRGVLEKVKKEFYQDGVLWEELKTFLEENNFGLVNEPNENHADILFLKKSL